MKGFGAHRCALHAAGLTYFTLLTFVPALCLPLLLARMCGAGDLARNQINARIDAAIATFETTQANEAAAGGEGAPSAADRDAKIAAAKDFAAQARAVSERVFERIDTFDVSTLGWAGLAMLLWSVVSTFGQIETAMNEIWSAVKPRPVWKRLYLYAFAAVVLPLLAAVASSLPALRALKTALDATVGSTAYTKWAGEALVAALTSRAAGFLVTFTFATLAFTYVISFMPNVKVERRAALAGGAFTALAFGGWMRLCATAQVGLAKSSALYGSLAFLPIILAWIYMSWQIILFGANLSNAIQTFHNGCSGPGGGDGLG